MFKTQLKILREENGFNSQQSFADAIGVSQSTVGNWESGTREPNLQTILKIANTLRVSLDDLLGNKQLVFSKSELASKHSGYWDGGRLSEMRFSYGYSKNQISIFLGISEDEYQQLEDGMLEPTLPLILRLSDAFGCDLDYICHRTIKTCGTSQTYSAEEKLLIMKYRALSEDKQIIVQKTLDACYSSSPGEEAPPVAKNA